MARSGCLEGSISMSSLQLHFLQTLEHRTDVSVTSTSPRWGAPEEHGPAQVPPPLCSTRGHPRPLLPSCPHLPMAVLWVGWGRWQLSWEGCSQHSVPKPPWCRCMPVGKAACPAPPPFLSQPGPLLLGLEILGSHNCHWVVPRGGSASLLRPAQVMWVRPQPRWLEQQGDGSMCWPFSDWLYPNLSLLFPRLESVCNLLQPHLS